MKLYLAGPMRGYPEFNFPEFERVANRLRQLGHEVFSPAQRDLDNGFDPTGLYGTDDELEALKFDLRAALTEDTNWICREAEGVAVLDLWDRSLGARAEVALGRALGLPIFRTDQITFEGELLRVAS